MPTGKVRNMCGTMTYVRGAMSTGTIAGSVIGAMGMPRTEIVMTGTYTMVRTMVARRTVIHVAAVMPMFYPVVGTIIARRTVVHVAAVMPRTYPVVGAIVARGAVVHVATVIAGAYAVAGTIVARRTIVHVTAVIAGARSTMGRTSHITGTRRMILSFLSSCALISIIATSTLSTGGKHSHTQQHYAYRFKKSLHNCSGLII